MTYLFSTTFFHKTAFEVLLSTNYKQYLIFLAGKYLKFLKEFGTRKILKRNKSLSKVIILCGIIIIYGILFIWKLNTNVKVCLQLELVFSLQVRADESINSKIA